MMSGACQTYCLTVLSRRVVWSRVFVMHVYMRELFGAGFLSCMYICESCLEQGFCHALHVQLYKSVGLCEKLDIRTTLHCDQFI